MPGLARIGPVAGGLSGRGASARVVSTSVRRRSRSGTGRVTQSWQVTNLTNHLLKQTGNWKEKPGIELLSRLRLGNADGGEIEWISCAWHS